MDEIKALQKSLFRSGIKRITYLGGEPFLNPDITDVSKNAKSLGLSRAVVTNGTAVPEGLIENIIREEIFDIIIFSIDGPENVHDNIRGVKGAFRKAVETLKNIQKLKKSLKLRRPKIYIYCTVSALNCDYLGEVFSLAQKLDAAALKFLSASCLTEELIEKTNSLFCTQALSDHSYAVKKELKIPEKELPQIRKELTALIKRSAEIGIKLIVENFLSEEKTSKECGIIKNDFVISAFGDIYPCPMLPELTIGNVRNKSLDKILTEPGTQDIIKNIYGMSSSGKLTVCRECCVEKLS